MAFNRAKNLTTQADGIAMDGLAENFSYDLVEGHHVSLKGKMNESSESILAGYEDLLLSLSQQDNRAAKGVG